MRSDLAHGLRQALSEALHLVKLHQTVCAASSLLQDGLQLDRSP